MKLFTSVFFGAFTGFLVDYWLGRAGVKDPLRLCVAVGVGVVVGALVYVGNLTAF